MIKVVSVNISKEKGTIKTPVDEIIIDNTGIISDAHSGNWHRQISLLDLENIEAFENEAKRKVNYGEFAENITISGINLSEIKLLDRFKINDVELEVSQIGKECHGSSCAIFKEVGNCIMPKVGIFCRVIKGGKIKANDIINFIPKVYKISVITLSDRAFNGEYTDRSGARIKELVQFHFEKSEMKCNFEYDLIPDNADKLKDLLLQKKQNKIDVIITTGGTGIGKRDITPETVTSLIDKETNGIMDFIRIKYGNEKPNALLSRSVAGIMGDSLVYALPGSVKAVEEYMSEILKVLNHSIFMLNNLDTH